MIPNDKLQKAVEMNHAIIRMRQPIRKARLFIVSKLTREAKKYRNRHADEKQLAKFKNKADRFVREIIALKKVKDDEIARYGILNWERLESTSQDPTVPDRTRIIAKIGNYKTILPILKDFTVKFKDYISMMSLETKKKKSKSKKNKSEESKELRVTQEVSSDKSDTDGEKDREDKDDEDSEDCENVDNDSEDDNDSDNRLLPLDKNEENQPIAQQSSEVKTLADTVLIKPEKKAGIKRKEKKLTEKESLPQNKLKKPVMVISKEASVKRFTEVLQEEDTENSGKDLEIPESQSETIQIEKTVDDFFMNADGSCGHLVAVPAPSMDTDDTNWEEDRIGRHFPKNSQRNQSGRTFANGQNWGKDSKRPGKWNDTDKPHSNPKKRKEYLDSSRKNEFAEGRKRDRSKEFSNPTEAINLHPSWEAKKKQQEIMKQGFQGKKIVFDD